MRLGRSTRTSFSSRYSRTVNGKSNSLHFVSASSCLKKQTRHKEKEERKRKRSRKQNLTHFCTSCLKKASILERHQGGVGRNIHRARVRVKVSTGVYTQLVQGYIFIYIPRY